jgi:CBS-domain-containing membrane protein
MKEHQVRRLPVVDEAGRLIGIVSLNDIALETVAKRQSSSGENMVEEMAATFAAICQHHNVALEKSPDRTKPPL